MNIPVTTAAGHYEVAFGAGVRSQLPDLVSDAARVAVIHPAALASLVHELTGTLDASVLALPVPDAEAAKTGTVLSRCWDELARAGFTRSDVIIGLGGGTTTDLAGFVAATWLRGVPYISVPTTVLAMVDAAVGGKTGINLRAGKNLVGSFYEPRGVICDLDLLGSLPSAEIRAGLAEVIKCGFIADDRILQLAEGDLDEAQDTTSGRFAEITRRAIQVKVDTVGADLWERTSEGDQVGREALNYGHTLGHAVEAHHDYTMRHGEAISIGMVWIAEVSQRILGLGPDVVARHRELLGGLRLPLTHEAAAWPALRRAMSLDKKTRGGTLRLVGLREPGRPVIIAGPDEAILENAYATLI